MHYRVRFITRKRFIPVLHHHVCTGSRRVRDWFTNETIRLLPCLCTFYCLLWTSIQTSSLRTDIRDVWSLSFSWRLFCRYWRLLLLCRFWRLLLFLIFIVWINHHSSPFPLWWSNIIFIIWALWIWIIHQLRLRFFIIHQIVFSLGTIWSPTIFKSADITLSICRLLVRRQLLFS